MLQINDYGTIFSMVIVLATEIQNMQLLESDPAIQDGGRRPYLNFLTAYKTITEHRILMCNTSKKVLGGRRLRFWKKKCRNVKIQDGGHKLKNATSSELVWL